MISSLSYAATEAAQQAKQIGTFEYPAFTWNLILTAAVGFMVWNLKRKISKADENLVEANRLKESLINQSITSLKESINSWQEGAKLRTAELCKKIDNLAVDLKNKVDVPHCNDRHHEVKEELKDLKDKIYT